MTNSPQKNVPDVGIELGAIGITVTDDLDWGQHINNVTSKAAKLVSHAET